MSCPEDANHKFCRCQDNGFLCTRDAGHSGNHHAHLQNGKCCHIWSIKEVKTLKVE